MIREDAKFVSVFPIIMFIKFLVLIQKSNFCLDPNSFYFETLIERDFSFLRIKWFANIIIILFLNLNCINNIISNNIT